MAFQNDVVGGITLVRPAIRSANYVPGVSGWSINRDGSAEFSSGTFRGPVVVIDPNTGQVLSSIGASGVGSFQLVSATNDILLGQLSVKQELTNKPKGLVGMFTTSGNPGVFPAAPANGIFADICWCSFYNDPTRLYRVQISPIYAVNNNVSNNQDLLIQLICNQQANLPGAVSNIKIFDSRSSAGGGRAAPVCGETIFGGGGAYGTMTVQMRAGSTDTNTHSFANFGIFALSVEDIGPFVGSVYTGGVGTAAGFSQYTVRYYCTSSQSYDSNGNPNGAADQNQNVYQGGFNDRPYGNERSYMIFNGAKIRSDLAGGTIQSARLYMYCIKASRANGTLLGGASTFTSVPATYDGSAPTGPNVPTDTSWPVPGWASMDLIGGNVLQYFLSSNGNSIACESTLFAQAPTGWVGNGPDINFRAYIEITYTNTSPPVFPPNVAFPPSRFIPTARLPLSTKQNQNRIR